MSQESNVRTGRRAFLVASAAGCAGLQLGRPSANANPSLLTASGGRAKSVILFFLCGGASHIDTWDMKPEAPSEYRGPFNPVSTSSPGVQLCEHLPLLGKQAHHLAIIRSGLRNCEHKRSSCGILLQLDGPRSRSDVSFAW
ncbi:MAG: DUF1501 domain-containing protein [Pirellulales bacterium]